MERLKDKKLFLFDMDGTLYLGNRLFDYTLELLRTIKERGGRYIFMTNNSSKSVRDYIKKLAGLGIEANYDDFMTSSLLWQISYPAGRHMSVPLPDV